MYNFNNFITFVSMVDKGIYRGMQQRITNGERLFTVLIDPDNIDISHIHAILNISEAATIDYFFIGGSHILHDDLDTCLKILSESTDIPLILFPGNPFQINERADAFLYLSLVSGRNADLLIGQQVMSAPYLYRTDLEIISTAYMLIDASMPTTASYISNSLPIPRDKPSIAVSTAIASEMLGFKQLYLDAGSGAQSHVSAEMIAAVRAHTHIPIIVGGGIRSPEISQKLAHAGADMIVVGNAIEKNPHLIQELSIAIKSIPKQI